MIQDKILNWSEATPDDFFVFHHLPKTAGTALSSGLSNFYGPDNYRWFHGPAGVVHELARGTDLKALGGHFHLNHPLASNIDEQLVMVTLFREPVDRVISNYYYLRNNTEHPVHEIAKNNSLTEIYQKGLGERIHVVNSITRMVALSSVPSKFLSSAKDMVNRYTFFGIQEQTNVMEALVRHILKADNFFIPVLTSRSVRPAVAEVDLETINLIKEHNQQDIALYEYAKSVYEEKLEKEWKYDLFL